MPVLKLCDLEYLSLPTLPRGSQKISQGLGPLLSPTPIPGLGSVGGDPVTRRRPRQSLTKGLDFLKTDIMTDNSNRLL